MTIEESFVYMNAFKEITVVSLLRGFSTRLCGIILEIDYACSFLFKKDYDEILRPLIFLCGQFGLF